MPVKFPKKNPTRDFFIAKALEWHFDLFTARQMAVEFEKNGFFVGKTLDEIISATYYYLNRYCVHVDDRKSILVALHAKKYRLKTEFI